MDTTFSHDDIWNRILLARTSNFCMTFRAAIMSPTHDFYTWGQFQNEMEDDGLFGNYHTKEYSMYPSTRGARAISILT